MPEGSNVCTRRMPPRPARIASQKAFRSRPSGVTSPSPVITARRRGDDMAPPGEVTADTGLLSSNRDHLPQVLAPQLGLGDADLAEQRLVDLLHEDVLVEDAQRPNGLGAAASVHEQVYGRHLERVQHAAQLLQRTGPVIL